MSQPYTRHFFALRSDGARRSAMVILPIVFKRAVIKSIVDFGCGTGTWLRCAADIGLSDIQGLDGEWVSTGDLCIAPHQFRRTDLTKPVTLDRKYDLAICLEVAEHLPASSASTLVESITQASDLILFSAAIPNQGGTHHINEQWQDYWVALFGQRGFAASDIVRPEIWGRSDVEWWYQQNTLLFAKGGQHLNRSWNMVHPQVLTQLDLFPNNPGCKQSLRMLKVGTKGLARCAFRKVTAAAARVYRGGRGQPE
jgi:Methyltransferase domain